jgi:hypothetical protein
LKNLGTDERILNWVLRHKGLDYRDWINLDQFRALVNTAVGLQVNEKLGMSVVAEQILFSQAGLFPKELCVVVSSTEVC